MRYTLRQLEVFLATSHHQNLSRAAEALAMSQSAASGALRELESQFDMQLFDRVGKRLRTSETGERLRPLAEAVLQQAMELESAFADNDTPGPLRIGATLTIGNYLCVDMIAEYLRLAPEARIHLDVMNTTAIVDALLNFDIDLALVEGEVQHSALDIRAWRHDRLVCFCAPNHPLAQSTALDEDDLVKANWILREAGSGTRQTFDRAMRGLNPDLTIGLELPHNEAIKVAVKKGLGISCLSEIVICDELDRGELVSLPVLGRNFARKLYLVIHKEKYRSPGIRRWIALCGLGDL